MASRRSSRSRLARTAALLAALFPALCHPQAERARACGACHGPDGNSTAAGTPSLAGQARPYLETQLLRLRDGARPSRAAAHGRGLTDAEIADLAGYFAKKPARVVEDGIDRQRFAQGRALAGKLRCGQCHGTDYSGQKLMPRLAGQREDYLESEMRAYRANRRPDDAMASAMQGVKDDEINALAHFLSRTPGRKTAR